MGTYSFLKGFDFAENPFVTTITKKNLLSLINVSCSVITLCLLVYFYAYLDNVKSIWQINMFVRLMIAVSMGLLIMVNLCIAKSGADWTGNPVLIGHHFRN
jgi:hypothetical protein